MGPNLPTGMTAPSLDCREIVVAFCSVMVIRCEGIVVQGDMCSGRSDFLSLRGGSCGCKKRWRSCWTKVVLLIVARSQDY